MNAIEIFALLLLLGLASPAIMDALKRVFKV